MNGTQVMMLQREGLEEVIRLCALCLSAPLRQKRTSKTLGFAAEGQRGRVFDLYCITFTFTIFPSNFPFAV